MRGWQITTYKVDPQELISCAICRNRNNRNCAECTSLDEHPTAFQVWCRKTLFTLLCAQKRVGCLFNLLNTHMISKIYSYSISHTDRFTLCTTTQLMCGHKFHTHCARKWYARREHCPLCAADYQEEYTDECTYQERGVLVDCALYSEPFEIRIKRKRREEHADAQIVKLLKAGGSYTEEELVPLIQGDVKAALQSLMQKEFIFLQGEDKRYYYLP